MPRLRHVAAACAAAVLALVLLASPAAAHDQLISSVPADGEALETGPDAVVLTFSGDITTVGAAAVVADGDGQDWASGELDADGPRVQIPLSETLPEGGYEVRWRVVSADGHPIEGRVAFTVGDAEPLPAPTADTDDGDASSASGPTSASATPTWVRLVLVGVGGAALALALWSLVRYFGHRFGNEDSE